VGFGRRAPDAQEGAVVIRRAGGSIRGRGLALVVLFAAGLGATAAPATADDVPFVQPTQTSTTDVAVLERASLQSADLRPPAVLEPYGAATIVRGQVSLDLCGATFPSESLRTGRLQVGAYVDDQQALSVEGILYRDDAAAKQAFAELERARSRCPSGYVTSRVAGVPPIKTKFRRVPRSYDPVPGVQRIAFSETDTPRDGPPSDVVTVYQRVGRLVVGLYGVPGASGAYLAPDTGGLSGLARLLGERMLAAQNGLAA
jgi:hypothetical protein